MPVVYFDPEHPSDGEVATAFQAAKGPFKRNDAVRQAHALWHKAARQASTPQEVLGVALVAAEINGCRDSFVGGLEQVGLAEQAAQAAEQPGLLDRAEQMVYAAGRGVRDIATAPWRSVETVAQEAGQTVRDTSSKAQTAQESWLDTMDQNTKLALGAFVGVSLLWLVARQR